MKIVEVAAIAAIFCFVAVAATYLVFNGSGQTAGADTANSIIENNAADSSMKSYSGNPDASFGYINGLVTDMNKNGMPNVTVTLWEVRLDNATGNYVNVGLADVERNPQVSWGEQDGNATGDYLFINVPLGTYNLTAEKDGHMASSLVNVTRGTTTMNLALPELVYVDPATMINVNNSDSQVTTEPDEPVIMREDGTPYNTLTGLVTDRNKTGVPGAIVTLWTCHADGGGYVNDHVTDVESNPQRSNSNGSLAHLGTYVYYEVPYGWYNVTVKKVDAAGNPHYWFGIVNATSAGTHITNVAIPDYIRG
jgi:hypothetical protein